MGVREKIKEGGKKGGKERGKERGREGREKVISTQKKSSTQY